MKRMLWALVPFSALAFAVSGLNNSHAASPAKAAVKHVSMINSSGSNPFAFSPRTIKIHVGTKVVWTNKSSAPHTVTATNSSFSSGTQNYIQPQKTWSHVFHKAGTYKYYCVLHPYMKATVIVMK